MTKKSFIDIHSHMLFGVDDGAKDIEESLNMLKKAAEEGAGDVILTPHYYEGGRNSSRVTEKFLELKAEAKKHVPEINIYLGNEFFGTYEYTELVKEGKVNTLAGSEYVLLEFAPETPFVNMERQVNSFLREGYVPIIAHAERYKELYKKPEHMRELKYMGALIQINCETFANAGFFEKGFLKTILKEDIVFAVGTDAHNMKTRQPLMADAYKWVVKNAGEDTAERIFCTNARVIITKK